MTPLFYFEDIWKRGDHLALLYEYLANNVSGIIKPEELLRAEWITRVSALDLYIHELIAQEMLEIFKGARPASKGYSDFQISTETLNRIRTASNLTDSSAAFDLEVRNKLNYQTYQYPDKIADGIRLFSSIELWNEVALQLGASQKTKCADAKNLKKDLSLIVERRNKIAHEGDLQYSLPREPWPICKADLIYVGNFIRKIVTAIDTVV